MLARLFETQIRVQMLARSGAVGEGGGQVRQVRGCVWSHATRARSLAKCLGTALRGMF
jgi:hypothetical protein